MKIPFNLHAAIDGKPVINGDGDDCEFELYYPSSIGTGYPVICRCNGKQSSYTKDGVMYTEKMSEKPDLFMKPEKITRWVYVHRYCGFSTKELAVQQIEEVHRDITVSKDAVSLIQIEFYPGEGLE